MLNTLKDSFKQAVISIKKHKLLFLLLFITQLVFLVAASTILMKFSISIGDSINEFIEPLENLANVPEEEIMTALAPLAEKYEHYEQMLKNLTLFVVYMYVVYIAVNGFNWSLSNLIVNRKAQFIRFQIKFKILFLTFTLPIIAIINVTAKYVFSIDQIGTSVLFYFIIAIIFAYFMYISFALIDYAKKIKEIPKVIKKALTTGIENILIILPTFFVVMGLPLLCVYIISTQLEANFFLLLSLIAVLILIINWGRITFITVIKNLEK